MKKIVVTAAILAALVLIFGLVVPHRHQQPRFVTVHVERGEIIATVSATGTLAAVTTVQVGTNVSGTIQKLFVDFNSPVRAGQVIAQIDPALYHAKVKETQGNYYTALSNSEKAKEELIDAGRTLERNRILFREGVVSLADLDSSETKYKIANATVKAAEWSVRQNEGLLDQARANLNYATIRSPISGVVISRNVDVGQTVAASFQTPTLFTIAQDLARMEIQADVDEADISNIRVGQPVSFTVDAYPRDTFGGTVSQIRKAPVITQNVVTYMVIITVENKDLRLMPGTTANVTIQTMRKPDVRKVPAAALLFTPDSEAATELPGTDSHIKSERVYVLRTGRAVPVEITTGLNGDGFIEIVKAPELKDDDAVIVDASTEKKEDSAGDGALPRGPTM